MPKIPAPFQKERIAVAPHGKVWQTLPFDQIMVGDIVRDLGLVVVVARSDSEQWYHIEFQSGEKIEADGPGLPTFEVFSRKR